jgi:UDP-2,3-diacylglucosamine pyrophosphatase LpxH
LFISDLHLGSNQCQATAVSQVLDQTEPRVFGLLGDIFDFHAICLRARQPIVAVSTVFERAMAQSTTGLPDPAPLAAAELLPPAHIAVLYALAEKVVSSQQTFYTFGNHDAYMSAYSGAYRSAGGSYFALGHEAIYTAPDQRRYLLTHGDRYDRVIHGKRRSAHQLTVLEENYAALVQGFRATARALTGQSVYAPPRGYAPDITKQASLMLDAHADSTGSRDAWSGRPSVYYLAEEIIKLATAHDRGIVTAAIEDVCRRNQATQPAAWFELAGVIVGHTHVAAKSRFAGLRNAQGSPIGPCHITYLNTGSFAREQKNVGNTALVFDTTGASGMIRYDGLRGLEAHRPLRARYNTHAMTQCDHCAVQVSLL